MFFPLCDVSLLSADDKRQQFGSTSHLQFSEATTQLDTQWDLRRLELGQSISPGKSLLVRKASQQSSVLTAKCFPGQYRLPHSVFVTCKSGVLSQEPDLSAAQGGSCSSEVSLAISSLLSKKHEIYEISLHCCSLEELPCQHFPKCPCRQTPWKIHFEGYSNVSWSDNGTFPVTGESNIFIFSFS